MCQVNLDNKINKISVVRNLLELSEILRHGLSLSWNSLVDRGCVCWWHSGLSFQLARLYLTLNFLDEWVIF